MAAHGSGGSKAASNFEPLDKLASSTLKRNPKMELSKTDLLKLLSYLEGELQARDVVIATLKAEKVKQLLYQSKHGSYRMEDPLAALQRDAFAACSPGFDEVSVRIAYSNQLLSLESLIDAQKNAHLRMNEQLKESEQQHASVVHELEEEKRKHAQDTAQGDDVTYLLEKERERLKQEVEFEKQQNRKIEKELHKVVAVLEQERAKQKQIVLLLLAERKRIITRLLEERRKCEELQQILHLEKGRMADMVDGLEEESQRSLQMEAELEQHVAVFEAEKAHLKQTIAVESERSQLLHDDNQRLQQETEMLKQQLVKLSPTPILNDNSLPDPAGPRITIPPGHVAGSTSPKPGIPPPTPAKPSSLHPPMPTKPAVPSTNLQDLYVSSSSPGIRVYWSGITTTVQGGPNTPPKVLAKSMKASSPVPAQSSEQRRIIGGSTAPSEGNISPPPVISTITKTIQAVPVSSPGSQVMSRPVQGPVRSIALAPTMVESASHEPLPNPGQNQVEKSQAGIIGVDRGTPQVVQVTPRVSVSAGPGTKVYTSAQGGKVTFHVTSTGSPQAAQPPQLPKKPIGVGRGTPPPVPPNKPVLTPQTLQKKEAITRSLMAGGDAGQPVTYEVKQQKVGPQGVKLGISIAKDKMTNSDGTSNNVVPSSANSTSAPDGSQVGAGTPTSPVVLPPPSPPNTPQSMELLGQELADFQQLLVSMVADGSPGLGSPNIPNHTTAPLCSAVVSNEEFELSLNCKHRSLHELVLQQDEASLRTRLSENENPNACTDDGTTPIHTAAAEGNIRCLKLLLDNGGDISVADNVGRTPLYSAAYYGHVDCLHVLLNHGANVSAQTQAGWTALHAAIQNDHLDCVDCLLFRREHHRYEHLSSASPETVRDPSHAEHGGMLNELAQHVFPSADANTLPENTFSKPRFCTTPELLALQDQDGWTPMHLAASKENDISLQLLLACSGHINLETKDNWGKTVRDVASTSCRELLDSLDADTKFCCIFLEWTKLADDEVTYQQIGMVRIDKKTSWNLLEENATQIMCDHFKDIANVTETNGTTTTGKKTTLNDLGLGADSISLFTLGNKIWQPGNATFGNSVLDTVSNNELYLLTIRLKGTEEGCSHSMVYSSLFPLSTLQNYLRLLEQYKTVVFYGPIGSGKTCLARHLGDVLKAKQGNKDKWTVIKIDLSCTEPDTLIQVLHSIGCLRCNSNSNNANLIIILDHLTPEIITNNLSEILPLLDSRGNNKTAIVTINGEAKDCYIPENCYIVATIDRFRWLGLNLMIQQQCRWVNVRPDTEPCASLLKCHLKRHAMTFQGTGRDSWLQWLQAVWLRVNQTLSKLGIVELAFGPFLFLPSRKDVQHSSHLLRFITRVWNSTITLAVEKAMTNMRPLTEQQVRMVDAALIVLLQKAVLPNAPVTLQERDAFIASLHGCTNHRLLSKKLRWNSCANISNTVDTSLVPNKSNHSKRLSDPTEKLVLSCNNLLKKEKEKDQIETKSVQKTPPSTGVSKKSPIVQHQPQSSKKTATSHALPNSPKSRTPRSNPTGSTKRQTNTAATESADVAAQKKTNVLRVKKIVSPVTPRSFSFLTPANAKDKKGSEGPAAKSNKNKK